MNDRSREHAMIEVFQAEPEYAAELLNEIVADGDHDELLLALRQIAKAFGGLDKLAGQAGLDHTRLYHALSTSANPELLDLARTFNSLEQSAQPLKA